MDNNSNVLKAISKALTGLDIEFRQIICWQCRWSLSTYYRKSNGSSPISNSDKASIYTLADEMKKKLVAEIQKIKNEYE